MKTHVLAIASVATMLSGCAVTYRVTPVETPLTTVRYDHGAPTTSLEQRNGAVQVTPMQFDPDGKLVFAVAAYNNAGTPTNFGTENIETSAQDRRLHIYTVDDLVREARNKAIAASVALAMLGVAGAAVSQAAAHQTYHSSFHTPYGAYHYKATYYDGAQAAAGTAASIAGASAGIYAVNRSLDAAIAGIGQTVLQTTTVDPGETVAGRVLVQRSRGKYPQEIAMLVHWNKEDYPFRFQVTKSDGRNSSAGPPLNSAASSPAPSQQQNPSTPTAASPAPAPPRQQIARPFAPDSPRQQAAHSSVAASPPIAANKAQAATGKTTASAAPGRSGTYEDDDAYNERMWKEQAKFER